MAARLSWLADARIERARPRNPGRVGPGWRQRALGVIVSRPCWAAACGVPTFWLVGAVPAFAAAAIAWTVMSCLRRAEVQRQADRDRAHLSATIAVLVDEYAAGATPATALRVSAPGAGRYRPWFEHAAITARAGGDVASVFGTIPDLPELSVGCRVAADTGAPLNAVLAGLVTDLDADRSLRRAVRAVLAGPRTSAALVSALPVIGLLMGSTLGANPVRFLLHTPLGTALLALGVTFDLAGNVWIGLLTRRALP